LLYSTPWYREQQEEGSGEPYVHRCVYHGKKAIQIDPKYINGHRDLAIGLIRYGRLERAKPLYLKALELADAPDKDEEIIKDALREVQELKDRAAPLPSSLGDLQVPWIRTTGEPIPAAQPEGIDPQQWWANWWKQELDWWRKPDPKYREPLPQSPPAAKSPDNGGDGPDVASNEKKGKETKAET
jgi:hypothetical protein